MNERVIWVDYAKVITIYLVILAHTPLITQAQNFIYVFHMPLFFFLAGYLFSFKKYSSFKEFFTRRFRQLMFPYFLFSIITFLFWLFIGRKFGNDSSLSIPLYQPLIGIIYGNGIQPWLIHCIPLWFFPCIFLVELIYFYLFQNRKNNFLYLISVFALAYLFIETNNIRLPWSFNTAIVALGIYAMGNASKDWIAKINSWNPLFKILAIGILSFIVYFISIVNGRINMHIHFYNNYFLFLIGAFSGILNIILISQLLEEFFKRTSSVEYFAKNTFIIVGFHLMIGSLIKAITVYIFKVSLDIYYDKFWVNVGFSFLTLILLVPVIFVLNSFFPYFLRNRSNTQLSVK